jgi:hypothetical protein
MQPALSDYLVKFAREELIAEIALAWRTEAGEENSAEFNVVKFVENVLAKKIKKKGPLHFSFFEMTPGGLPAFVTFEPLTLHIDSEVWEHAKLGNPESRTIVAHEVGHLILHDHHAKAFSSTETGSRFQTKETSAEWQANTFAAYFLLPDHIVAAFNNGDDLANSCSVTKKLANQRVEAVREARRPRPKLEGNFCIKCGEITKRMNGSVKCGCETQGSNNLNGKRAI